MWSPSAIGWIVPGAAHSCLTLAQGRHNWEGTFAAEAVLIRCRSQPTGAKWNFLGIGGWSTGVSGKMRNSQLRLIWDGPPQLVLCLWRGWDRSRTFPFVTRMPATRHSCTSPFCESLRPLLLLSVLGFSLVGCKKSQGVWSARLGGRGTVKVSGSL